MAEEILTRLKAPRELRESAVTLIGEHMERMPLERGPLKRRIRKLGWPLAEKLFYLQHADLMSKGTDTAQDRAYFPALRQVMDSIRDCCLQIRDLAIDGRDLMALGYDGRDIGKVQKDLLELVLDDKLPNTREALLQKAGDMKQ